MTPVSKVQLDEAKRIIASVDNPSDYHKTLTALSEGFLFAMASGDEDKAEEMKKLMDFLLEDAERNGYALLDTDPHKTSA